MKKADDGTVARTGPPATDGRESGKAGMIDTSFVLDAPAMLAYLRGDGGGAVVQRVLRQCWDFETRAAIAADALQEVYAVAAKESPDTFDDLWPLIDQLPLDTHPVTADTAREVADLIAADGSLSGSQAAGLALSKLYGATLVTADPALSGKERVLYVGP